METAKKWGKRLIIVTAVTGGITYGVVSVYKKVKREKELATEEQKKLKLFFNCNYYYYYYYSMFLILGIPLKFIQKFKETATPQVN